MSEPLHELDKEYPRQTSDEVLPPPSKRDDTKDVEQPHGTPPAGTGEVPPAGDAPPAAPAPLPGGEGHEDSGADTPAEEPVALADEPLVPGIERPDSVLAIVVIHGMGTSKPGDMLERYMNASLEWIKRATTEDHNRYVFNNTDENLVRGVNRLERNRARVEAPTQAGTAFSTDMVQVDVESLPSAVLQSADNHMQTFQPPYIEVELSERKSEGNTTIIHKVVAVEAWWDGEFESPAFRDVAYWALGVAPNLILRHLALMWTATDGEDATTVSLTHEVEQLQNTATQSQQSVKKHWKQRIGHDLTAFVWNVFGSLAAVVAQWFICILLVLGAIPFLQKYVRNIILKVTSSFGDVLVYVHDGVRSAAIRSAVERSFQWVFNTYKAKDQKLIVMAHSLGSVIAYDVLNRRAFHEIQTEEPEGLRPEREVSLITFGSPLKKANILLQLKRDEQRVSLGIIFAFMSLLMAILALVSQVASDFGWNAIDFHWPQYLFIVATVVATLGLGIGAHMPPRLSGLSNLQIAGSVSAAIALALLLVMLWIEDRFVSLAIIGALGLAACVYWLKQWLKKVQGSRIDFKHDRHRLSQSLIGDWILLGLVAAGGASLFLTPLAVFLLGSLIFSAMSASNPLEEFELENGAYVRRPPQFHFQTKIKRWIDFWATRDLVSEFGLGEVKYRTNPEGEFDEPVHSRRVTNFHALLRDHTSFVANIEQFIAPVTRFFLEQIGARDPIAQKNYGESPKGNVWGSVKVSRNYEQDISQAMHVRQIRIRWLNSATVPLIILFLLLGPGVYRSVGEYIVFDQPARSAGQGKIAGFYNPEPLKCNEKCTNIRTLPILADDISINLIRNDVTRNVILFGLGYGIAAVVMFVLRNIFLTSSWSMWESAILDTIVQRRNVTSWNLVARRTAFMLFAAVFLLSAVAINIPSLLEQVPWLDLTWIPTTGNAPAQTVLRFIDWAFDPMDWHLVKKMCNAKWNYVCAID